MVWWNQRKFQKSKFHLLTGINICTRFSTSQHNEQNLHCWASSFQHLLFPKNKQRHRKKNPPQKKNVLLLLKVIPPSLGTSSALMKTLWCWETSFWLPAEQTGKSEWAVNCLQLASTRESVDVTWSLQQTPVTRCYEMAMKPPVALLTSLCFKRSLPFFLVLSLAVFLCALHVHLC